MLYKGTEFYINLDQIKQPELGTFVEVKSRTWSRKDAELKSELSRELLARLVGEAGQALGQDYIEIVRG